MGIGPCEGTTVAVGLVAVGLRVADDSSDGTAVAVGVAVEAVAQAFKVSRKIEIKERTNRNFRMNTSGGRLGFPRILAQYSIDTLRIPASIGLERMRGYSSQVKERTVHL